ncbi:hypothetical protein MT349_18665 [Rathayibacter caricis]|uniref:hypothetical protein n=1 Tax=Rathayibacter caricis TaxID=110936 RepID=UPI001FB46C33|nr:hypothetical protein [Rathayibacter caricis]MCJ1697810.1 hypothetical protein [Rathayibacter caricis]
MGEDASVHNFFGLVVRHRLTICGMALLGLGLGASVWLAFAASSKEPPDGAQSALLVVIGSIFNVGGAWAVSRRPGAPNETAARMAIRHLAEITRGVGEVKQLAEEAFDSRSPGKTREDLGPISVRLSDTEGRLVANLDDWVLAYPGLVDPALDRPKNEPTEEK